MLMGLPLRFTFTLIALYYTLLLCVTGWVGQVQ